MKKARVEHLYAIADGEVIPEPGKPEVIFCVDEFGPLNLQPRPGRQWAAVSGKSEEPGRASQHRLRATYRRTAGVRHLFAAYELGEDKLFGHIKPRKNRARFLEFCRYLRSLYPPDARIAIICDNFSPHLTTAKDARVGTWAQANNAEIAYTPTNSSWLNRIEAQFTALRYFALDGTDQPSHQEQGSMIRRYITWRNNHAYDERLRRVIDRANVACCGTRPVQAGPHSALRQTGVSAPVWPADKNAPVPSGPGGWPLEPWRVSENPGDWPCYWPCQTICQDRICSLNWWSGAGSNRRPSAFQADQIPG